MKNSFSSDENYNLWMLLNQVSYAIFKAREKELSQYGISPIQAFLFFALESLGGKATPTEIAKWLFREPHTVSSLLIRMEKEGLVRKAKDLDRKNRVSVVMTDKGREAYRHSLARRTFQEIMSCLSEEERQQLWPILGKLRERALQNLATVRKLPFP